MNKQEQEALQEIILYLVLSEAKHYEESGAEERKKHIYKAVMKVARWLDKQKGL